MDTQSLLLSTYDIYLSAAVPSLPPLVFFSSATKTPNAKASTYPEPAQLPSRDCYYPHKDNHGEDTSLVCKTPAAALLLYPYALTVSLAVQPVTRLSSLPV